MSTPSLTPHARKIPLLVIKAAKGVTGLDKESKLLQSIDDTESSSFSFLLGNPSYEREDRGCYVKFSNSEK